MQAIEIALRFFEFPLQIFTSLLSASGMWGFYLAVLAMYAGFRFLVAPVLGAQTSALSDSAVRTSRRWIRTAKRNWTPIRKEK